MLHDAANGDQYVPLQSMPQARASFEIHNSPLTENATIGFEFGYNLQEPGRLVIWEAQYGDFINGAQVILDQFLTSGRAKWGLRPSLVLLLPHGYEGQGPEHSSARPERFLQAAADINMRLVNCTTAAQYFHVLRRQALLLEKDPLPLIVLTPKSLLRHQAVWSTPQELADGRFLSVIDDADARQRASAVTRLVLCSGKVSVDVLSHERRASASEVAVCRVEQLYPFPKVALSEVVAGYPSLREVVWLQEEPENMGGVGIHAAAARRADRRRAHAALHRPGAQFQPVGGLAGVASAEPEGIGVAGVRARDRRHARPRSCCRRPRAATPLPSTDASMPNIVVPTLGESVVEARVSRWLKQEGDRVNVGDALVSLETEKVDIEVSADVSGVLASITRREGEDVQIGEVLGVIEERAASDAPRRPPPLRPRRRKQTPRPSQRRSPRPSRRRPRRRPRLRPRLHAAPRLRSAWPSRTPWTSVR